MVAAVSVLASKGKAAIPTETVRAFCKVLIVLEELLPVSK